MLIRSQNREILINFNTLAGIEIVEGPIKTIITSYITGCAYLLGEYSNKAKAMKILDMIQEAYSENEALKTISTGALTTMLTKDYATTENVDSDAEMLKNYTKIMKKSAVFQIPYDSEVEV
nr:MAG TPA: hypothetical protein [Caudoviricetes sp.]